MPFSDFRAFLDTNWGWATALAAAMVGLTLAAGALLNPARRDEIALWLMGVHTDETWSKSFVALFDAVFGDDHLSLRCFLRSSIASLIAVAVIWLMIGSLGTFAVRMQADLSLGTVLLLALMVNAIADYVSLLETRLLLKHIHRARTWLAQAGILFLDFGLSATIILVAIGAYIRSPLYVGDGATFAEVIGLFSIFSVLFYSTFLTSVWTWAYILSTFVMRVATRLRLAHFLDVENKPVQILAYVVGLVTFSGAMALAVPLSKDADGLTAADRALCTVFKGRVCVAVAELTVDERVQFEMILLACDGGVTEECLVRGLAVVKVRPEDAARLWSAACARDDYASCTNLGIMHQHGTGMEPDLEEAARLYRLGCDGGSALGCTWLGSLYERGLTLDLNLVEAARLYRQGCDGGDAQGCTSLGFMFALGNYMDRDPIEAGQLFRRGCDGGDARGCTSLGLLQAEDNGMDRDPAAEAKLFRKGCEGGHAAGCYNLGVAYQSGIGVDPDQMEAARLYHQACDGGVALGCANLGHMYAEGFGIDPDPVEAAQLYRQACDGGELRACTNLGILHHMGHGMDPDPTAAARLYRQSCDGGEARGCTNLGILYQTGLGMDSDPVEATRLYRIACDGEDGPGCHYLAINHEKGVGVPADAAAAVPLFAKACRLGIADACARATSAEEVQ